LELTSLSLPEAGQSSLPPASRESATAGRSPANAGDKSSASSTRQGEAVDPLILARTCLEDMKAEEVVEIDLLGKTSLADAMVIASGRANRHVGAIADHIVETFKAHGLGPVRVEGMPACDWVLIDAGDLIVHVFRPEVRVFYNLEKMWGADRPNEREAS
jgi:ribosome-associated protein